MYMLNPDPLESKTLRSTSPLNGGLYSVFPTMKPVLLPLHIGSADIECLVLYYVTKGLRINYYCSTYLEPTPCIKRPKYRDT